MILASPQIEIAEEIRQAVQEDDLSRATRRLLDYAKQFSGSREMVRAAIAVTREFNAVRRDIRRKGTNDERESKINDLVHRVLELVDEIEQLTQGPLAPTRSEESPPLTLLPPTEPAPTEDPLAEVDEPAKGLLTGFERARERFIRRRTPKVPDDSAEFANTVSGLEKSFRRGDFKLAGVDLELRPGEIIGLVGVNGSGKTTLLRMLAGELAADGGRLAYPLLSENPTDWPTIRSQIAFVKQRPPRWYGLLEESLYLHAAISQITGRANRDEVEFILHRLGLEGYRRAKWHEISGGFQMRFELAKALAARPRLLILDEPLAPLDINTQQLFLQDLRDIADSYLEPLPIILSSQHIFEVEAIADKILFLDEGKVVFYGSLKNLYEDREESTYELATPVDRTELTESLESLGVIEIEHTGLTYIACFPSKVSGERVLRRLLEAEIEVRYFRDISGSSRKLFMDYRGSI